MKIITSILFYLIFISFQCHGQKHKYLATATTNQSIINYVHAIDSGIVLIDFLKIKKSKWKKEFEKVSGLLLSGGRDVNPKKYGVKDSLNICIIDPKRDVAELFLIESALSDSLPILGICRGHQITNVGMNGALYQDIPTQHNSDTKVIHRDSLLENYVYHDIQIDTNSALFEIYEVNELYVNSFHHQAVTKEGDGMKTVARTADGICEATEWSKGLADRWIVGVQFHPEKLFQNESIHLKLIDAYIKACFN